MIAVARSPGRLPTVPGKQSSDRKLYKVIGGGIGKAHPNDCVQQYHYVGVAGVHG